MTVLERTAEKIAVGMDPPPSVAFKAARVANCRSRFAVYFTRYGWIHALLLMGVWLFLFPFAWMIATEREDRYEELLTPRLDAGRIVRFRPDSPYVRERRLRPAKLRLLDVDG